MEIEKKKKIQKKINWEKLVKFQHRGVFNETVTRLKTEYTKLHGRDPHFKQYAAILMEAANTTLTEEVKGCKGWYQHSIQILKPIFDERQNSQKSKKLQRRRR